MRATSDDVPPRLVVDAGPLIALLDAREPEHAMATAGVAQLVRARSRIVAPLPIIFEVYKWLVYETHPAIARRGLQRMQETLAIDYPDAARLQQIVEILDSMPMWSGSLEDALVAVTGLWLDVPVWTLNYRDLAAIPNLQIWTPSGS